MNECTNCGKQIKSGVFGSNPALTSQEIAIINAFHEPKSEIFCQHCGFELHIQYERQLKNDMRILQSFLENNLNKIPLASIHSPHKWEYEMLGIVTGQATMGTGIFIEFVSSFTDFFGAESGSHNEKLRIGEERCKMQLITQSIQMGGNAVIACDVDYSELGSDNGLIMVCMTGTAVSLKNLNILNEDRAKKIQSVVKAFQRLEGLKKLVDKK